MGVLLSLEESFVSLTVGDHTPFLPKQIGTFGVELQTLVERNGADSMHGAGPAPVRIPSFMDDIISGMKQMGEPSTIIHAFCYLRLTLVPPMALLSIFTKFRYVG